MKSFPIASILGLLFIGLKLTGYIAWSWLWVLAPFWLPFAVAGGYVLVLLLLFVVACVLTLFKK